MNKEWAYYPFSAIMAAASSTTGGVITLLLALDVGTFLAVYAVSDECLELGAFLVCGIVPIVFACIALWGFLCVAILAWALHGLVFRDASRFLLFAPLVLMQYLVTFLAGCSVDADFVFEPESAVRLLAVSASLICVVATQGFVMWRLGRKRNNGQPRGYVAPRRA
jgi:hypothetical protein